MTSEPMEQLALQFETLPPADPWQESWMVYSAEHELWLLCYPADLAAKYHLQGCLVRLMPDGDISRVQTYLPRGRTMADYPEADPYAPPFSPQEIVWNYRADQWRPDTFYREKWDRIADWLRSTCDHPMPEEYAESLSQIYGRWGGGYDLEATEKSRKAAVKVPEMAIPF